ncbi:MAG: tRNA pseudouridine(38-40) synthase TruA [Desulfuromonadales bacterium]|nr:tRNA pseudouridine(38-40) synthase TruA [Desulfuromonadales bacterium]
MRKICLTIEYDGTDFVGWQYQPNGLSVQESVETALAERLGESVRLISASRTDAGVHARGMVAHFETSTNLPIAAYREGVNTLLPSTIAITAARSVANDFHARYDARGKWYRYTIMTGTVRSPLNHRQAWFMRSRLDLFNMRQAAEDFVGEHDFGAFRTSGCTARTTRRTVYSVDICAHNEFIIIDVRGSGFLRNMVRMMVGTLAEIGAGKRPVTAVAELFAGSSERTAFTAPAHGLCLMAIEYQ